MSGEGNTPGSKSASPQCQFFVQRKKRLCRMTVKPGRQYCGEHEPHPKTEAGQSDKRIPCPNDPKHTCYASKLLKHLAICNARLTDQPPYIIENINAPEAVETCPRLPLSSYPKDVLANVIDKVNCLYAKHVEGHITTEPPSPIHRAVLPEFSETDRAESSLRHLRQVSALLWCAERAPLPAPRACYVELGAGKGQLSYYAAHAWCAGTGSRVLAVDRAPLRHKRDNKLRSAPPTPQTGNTESIHQHDDITKESSDSMRTDRHDLNNGGPIGEGHSDSNGHISEKLGGIVNITDGQLNPSMNNLANGHITSESRISKSNENDRINPSKAANSDSKRDPENTDKTVSDQGGNESKNTIRDTSVRMKGESGETDTECSEGESVAVRLRADLAHLALEVVPVVAEASAVVGLAKHLCGVATDYALRCIAAAGVVSKTKGLVLATCCHHRVERAPYVAHRQLQELGINAEEFNIMLGIVSWATCGDGRSRERRLDRPEEGGRQEGREETGRRAKALLDWGRVLWLRGRGFEARLCYYVPREVSLENVAIVAVKR